MPLVTMLSLFLKPPVPLPHLKDLQWLFAFHGMLASPLIPAISLSSELWTWIRLDVISTIYFYCLCLTSKLPEGVNLPTLCSVGFLLSGIDLGT